jgi:hypothetical protein
MCAADVCVLYIFFLCDLPNFVVFRSWDFVGYKVCGSICGGKTRRL